MKTPILISPSENIILDENYFLIGESRRDISVLDLAPIEKRIDQLELLSMELLSALDPSTQPLISSRPRRSGIYKTAGFLSNLALGFILGCAAFTLAILIYLAWSSPETLSLLVGG